MFRIFPGSRMWRWHIGWMQRRRNSENGFRGSWFRHEIDYKKPAFVNEELSATTWVGEWTAVKCERFTEIQRGEVLLVKGRTVWCMVDRESFRASRITKELIDRFI